MSLNSQKILGIAITTSKRETILEEVEKWLDEKRGKPRVIVTPNPEQLVLASQEKRFADILNRADVALPDGIGLARALGVSRIAGVEFMEDLVALAAKRGDTIGLIGGQAGLAVKALECLKEKYPELRGWALDPGLVSLGNLGDLSDLSEKIQKTNTRFVFVGFGAPKQEFFIEKLQKQLVTGKWSTATRKPITNYQLPITHSLILMSVGGSIDILSGKIQRAPVFIRNVGIEWLWRLFQEPWRWRRQLALLKFVFLALREKVRSL